MYFSQANTALLLFEAHIRRLNLVKNFFTKSSQMIPPYHYLFFYVCLYDKMSRSPTNSAGYCLPLPLQA